MLLTAKSGGHATTKTYPQLAVFEVDSSRGSEIASPLVTRGYRVRQYGSTTEAIAALRDREPPALLILAADLPGDSPPPTQELRAHARALGIPMLEVVDAGLDPYSLLDREIEIADWVSRGNVPVELPVRVERLLRRNGQGTERMPTSSSMPTDSRFFPLIVHDLRTPLNVVGLSLRMIDQTLPPGNPEIQEDLRFVEEGFKQIEGMLTLLSDYYRLFETEEPLEPTEFSPERLVSEVVETSLLKAGSKSVPIHVEVRPSCPPEALLSPDRAKQAIQYALANAMVAAKVEGVHVTMHGGPDRWVTEFRVNQPPPTSVSSVELRPDKFERLCGSAAERRGMDLAIAARISELFGGAARLEVDESSGSTIILDWPARAEVKS